MSASSPGEQLHAFAERLYPICRSITGNGVRRTLRIIGERIPLSINEVPSGSEAFDWEVPLEWNIEDAWIEAPDGKRLAELGRHNLHIVSYSEPIRATVDLAALRHHLHTLPAKPDLIPYRTSYYRRQWGFCLSHRDAEALEPGKYHVVVESSLAPGSLTYGECFVPGRSTQEVVLFTHVCHPSLANDNTSGMTIATELAAWLASEPRRFGYRIVFAPGTIGSLCWLRNNEHGLKRIRHGLVIGLLGDPQPLTYKQSRRGNRDVDRIVPFVLRNLDASSRVIPFEPYGYDERQLCSPGFDLPVGRLTRAVNDGYPEYHTSADDLSLVTPGKLEESLEALKQIVTALEDDVRYINMCPKGEPQLGKRGLYGSMGGSSPADAQRAMLWVLSQSDGHTSLVDISAKADLPLASIKQAATQLEAAGLLKQQEDPAPPANEQ